VLAFDAPSYLGQCGVEIWPDDAGDIFLRYKSGQYS
jgi:hypothetical protein